MKKQRDLAIIAAIYLLAFLGGLLSCKNVENLTVRFLVFDIVATVITFVFSVIFTNSSVYDAYWSAAPMVMSVWLFFIKKAFAPMQVLFLVVFNLWSLRLTLNWAHVFTDFSYEDWRYRMFREKSPRLFWPLVNFWGIHMMPTLVVFAGMLPMFVIVDTKIGLASIPGILVMLLGILLEFFADRQMHEFLENTTEKTVCRNGLWNYSRHPNYLGEISVWLGVFLVMVPYAYEYWYYGVGFVCVAFLFNVISIPMMEKRQMERRSEYGQYRNETSRLLLLPSREGK